MSYKYVTEEEIEKNNNLIIKLIEEQLGENHKPYSLTSSFEKIGLNNMDSAYVITEIEFANHVENEEDLNKENYAGKYYSKNIADKANQISENSERKKRKSKIWEKIFAIFIPDIAKEIFSGNYEPNNNDYNSSNTYEPDETGLSFKDCCYRSPQDVLDEIFRKLSKKRERQKQEERKILQRLAKGE